MVPPLEGETVGGRADELDGDTVIPGDTGGFLDSGVAVPPPEEETAGSRADELDGDTVIPGDTGEFWIVELWCHHQRERQLGAEKTS